MPSTAARPGLFWLLQSPCAPETSLLTIEFKVNLMSPGRGERFLFRGEITKPGSTIIVSDGRAYAISDGPAKLIASMTGTMMVIRGREDIVG